MWLESCKLQSWLLTMECNAHSSRSSAPENKWIQEVVAADLEVLGCNAMLTSGTAPRQSSFAAVQPPVPFNV